MHFTCISMQWRGTRGLRERASARKKKQWRGRRSNELVNSKSKKGFSLNKASEGRNVGCDMACEAEAARPLTGGNFRKLPRYPCAMVSSRQIIAESNHINDVILWVCISLYIQAKSKEYKSKNCFLSL
jgi:hypothetical protein